MTVSLKHTRADSCPTLGGTTPCRGDNDLHYHEVHFNAVEGVLTAPTGLGLHEVVPHDKPGTHRRVQPSRGAQQAATSTLHLSIVAEA